MSGQIPIPLVISHDEDDVWFGSEKRGLLLGIARDRREDKKTKGDQGKFHDCKIGLPLVF
jgi:hypothetical protein